jgi:hypothetical protein
MAERVSSQLRAGRKGRDHDPVQALPIEQPDD